MTKSSLVLIQFFFLGRSVLNDEATYLKEELSPIKYCFDKTLITDGWVYPGFLGNRSLKYWVVLIEATFAFFLFLLYPHW